MLVKDKLHYSKRPLINLDSKLRDMPAAFARDVLPHLTWYGFEPCWIWFGSVDFRGYPIMRRTRQDGSKKLEQFMMRRLVASMFWQFPDDAVIKLSCENINCLNPNHLVVSRDRWRK